MFVWYAMMTLCRYIMLKPRQKLHFQDEVTEPGIYKFIFDTREWCSVEILDTNNIKMVKTDSQRGSFYVNIKQPGFVNINVQNKTEKSCKFNFKSPDVNKEMSGYLGYVEDQDMVGELARILDRLIEQQKTHINKTYEHYEMVKRSKKWVRFIVVFELGLTGFAVYLIHKDFVSMFESKRSV